MTLKMTLKLFSNPCQKKQGLLKNPQRYSRSLTRRILCVEAYERKAQYASSVIKVAKLANKVANKFARDVGCAGRKPRRARLQRG